MSQRTLLVLTALLAALPRISARAADAPQPPPAEATILHLNERAERQMARDELVLLLRGEATAAKARDAQAELNRRMAAALDEARKATAVKVETPAMDASEMRQKDKPPVWKASETLQLRSKDFAAALALLGKLEDQGLLVSAMRFEVSRDALKGAEDALTAEALTRLRQRADAVAAAMGLAVDHVRNLQVGEAGAPGPRPLAYAITRQREAMPEPAADAGEAPVSVTVSAEVWLMPKR
jgi:predicted secreted protein